MSRPVRIGLVGCGRLAELGYLPAVGLVPAVVLAGVADPDPGRRQLVADAAGVAGHADAEALLGAGGIDAVVLASPAAHHVDDARRAARAGLPVLVEKPPAPDRAGAERLAALGPAVSVGFNRRYDPAIRSLREAVPGAGPVELDLSIRYRPASWNAHTVRDDVLLDLGPHLVDLVRWLARTGIETVRTVELRSDHAVLAVTHGRGQATIEVGVDRFHTERITVRDASGTELARHRVGGPVGAVVGRVLAARRPHPLVASLAAQLEAFADAVDGVAPDDLGTSADGVAAMAVIDAARASAADGGRPVSLDAADVPDVRDRPDGPAVPDRPDLPESTPC